MVDGQESTMEQDPKSVRSVRADSMPDPSPSPSPIYSQVDKPGFMGVAACNLSILECFPSVFLFGMEIVLPVFLTETQQGTALSRGMSLSLIM